MGDLFFYIAAFVFVVALIVLGAWAWRMMVENGINVPGNTLFKASRDKRIGFVESASIDGHRKLVLIRRDGVEHLIMTGGPVDVVIETGIENGNSEYRQDPPIDNSYFEGASLNERLYGGNSAESSFQADE